MAEAKRKRARTPKGHYKADDPTTPDVNEAYEEPAPKKKAPAKKKAAPKKKASSNEIVVFETREQESVSFPVAGIDPVRNYQTNRLEYHVQADDVERFMMNHFVQNARVVRKGD